MILIIHPIVLVSADCYDFTLPDSDWIPVNENVDDEIVEIPLEVARVIRECVENN